MIFSRVRHVDLFPGSKKAEIEYVTDEEKVTYGRFGTVWEAIFEGAVTQFSTCSYVRMVYDEKGTCFWDPSTKKLECKKDNNTLEES